MLHTQSLPIRSCRWSSTSTSTFFSIGLATPKLIVFSQGFDRGDNGFERSYDPKWSLAKTKGIFNNIQVEMEKNGGWNSN
jgi:hypothetical protein